MKFAKVVLANIFGGHLSIKSDHAAIGTICFITYGRGKILLETVKELIPDIAPEWPILVVDNASKRGVDEYLEIKKLADATQHFDYVRHKRNIGFQGNIGSLFELVETQFFLIVSDEDKPSIETLLHMVPFLKENRDIGAILTSIGTVEGVKPSQQWLYKQQIFEKGDGIGLFGLSGNYITGTIYNRLLLKKLNIPERLKRHYYFSNRDYPHQYINILAAANTRTMFSDKVAVFEGMPETYEPELFTEYFGNFSYGARLDQFFAFRDALVEAFDDCQNVCLPNELNISRVYESYVTLCNKYQRIIYTTQGNMYIRNKLNLKITGESFALFCIAAVDKLPYSKYFKDSVAETILATNHRWLQESSHDHSQRLKKFRKLGA